MSQKIYLRWLQIASIATVLTGSVASFASHPSGEAIWRLLFDLLKGFDPERRTVFTPDNYATNAVLGGVMIGWGAMMFLLVSNHVFNENIRKIVLKSIALWFITDSLGSYAADLPGNIILNSVFMIMFVIPLIALRKSTSHP